MTTAIAVSVVLKQFHDLLSFSNIRLLATQYYMYVPRLQKETKNNCNSECKEQMKTTGKFMIQAWVQR